MERIVPAMNENSMRAVASSVLNCIQVGFPVNRAASAIHEISADELMANREPHKLLSLLASKLAPPKPKAKPKAAAKKKKAA